MSQQFSQVDMHNLFEQMKRFSLSSNNKGITRLAYSEEDEAAHNFLISTMTAHGLQVRRDAIGNVFARLPGKNSKLPAIGTGSHLDTVPQGGAYDGAVGVLTGLFALLQFKPKELYRDLELIVFRAEESSRFGFSCIGSKVLVGKIDQAKWQENRDDQGINFFEALDNAGYDSKLATNKECQLPENYFSAFVEVHIEQGKCLEVASKKIGVVHGIAAPIRFRVDVNGHADHSGATPMGQRHDALVASTYIIQDINLIACKESFYGTVATVGKLDVYPNSMNVIPGSVSFYVDIRGIEVESIQRVVESFKNSVAKVGLDNNVQTLLKEISSEEPVKLDNGICSVIESLCQKQQISYLNMQSGAGHDSMNMAKICPTAMIFIPSKDGVSHHPDEFSDFEDVVLSANLLKDTLEQLANKQED